MRAARLVLASFLGKYGYDDIRSVTTAVIDYYGASGFSKELKLTREQLDEHFGVPVLDTIDAMTTELQRALHAEMHTLLAPALKHLPRSKGEQVGVTDMVVPLPAADGFKAGPCETSIGRVLNARPTGPGPWRARMT